MAGEQIPKKSNWPLYWFAVLEQAVKDGDHQRAAKAQERLSRLGVEVRYGTQQQTQAVEAAHG